MKNQASPLPAPSEPAASWAHRPLWEGVKNALMALPAHFHSDTFIEGVDATDVFTLNAALGATIESQVVATLSCARQSLSSSRIWNRIWNYYKLPRLCGSTRGWARPRSAGHPSHPCHPCETIAPAEVRRGGIQSLGCLFVQNQMDANCLFVMTPIKTP